MSDYDFQLLVIGAGSGGVRAARTAASAGVRVGIIEDGYWGGTCVNLGCVPKKLYSYAAHFAEDFADAAGYGWTLEPPEFDWETLRDNQQAEIQRLNGIYTSLLENSGVERLEGRGQLVSEHQVAVNGRIYSAERILIATGSWPYVPDFPGAELCLTSNEIFNLPEFPKRFLVYGGGYIAVEFASIFNGLGAKTYQVYRGDQILRGFDNEVRGFVQEEMQHKGVHFFLNQEIQKITQLPEGLQVTLASGQQLEVDAVLSATGRRGNTQDLGLDKVGIFTDAQDQIPVNGQFCTSVPSLYALGDVTGGPQLTPVALAEAMAWVNTLYLGENKLPLDYSCIATAVFCHPNIGTVGLSEEAAREEFEKIRVYTTCFRPMRNTLAKNPGRSFMKLVVEDASDRVLGCHIVGPDAGELVQGVAIAVKAGLTKTDFDTTLGIHPTSAEELVTLRSLTRY